MCRWFAYISPTEPCLLADVLISPPHGLTKQVSSHYLPYLSSHHLADDMVDDLATDPSKPAAHLAPPTKDAPPNSASARAAYEDLKKRNLMLNDDGSGFAIFTPYASSYADPDARHATLYPATYHIVQPFAHEINFQSLAAHTQTTCLMAHQRACVGGAPVAVLNVHPFTFGRWAVMHNGEVAGGAKARRKALAGLSEDAYAAVQGGTDSEVLGAVIVDLLTDAKGQKEWHVEKSEEEVFAAVEKAFKTVIEIQKSEGKPEPSSLNVCISDGRVMVATRFRNVEDPEQPPSLYWSETAGVTLNSKFKGHPDEEEDKRQKQSGDKGKSGHEHGKHVIIASEPSTFKEEEWKLLPKNTAILVNGDGKLQHKKLGPF